MRERVQPLLIINDENIETQHNSNKNHQSYCDACVNQWEIFLFARELQQFVILRYNLQTRLSKSLFLVLMKLKYFLHSLI
ncbi:hypothetical protein FGO68_gene6893 [Halteria grandinella]|uniref:Uncharacterized protein n=1 Tax=Halteria grandinella TaxID=5974 RepID=A0A8J8P4S5_HALGN|nr:hypothetical protein FGO68_gene6893 [Halteria grandinella]